MMTYERDRRAGGLVLLAVCSAAVAMPLAFTAPAIALPAIGRSLGGTPIALNWVTNAFMLGFGSSLMAAGALADGYGRKRLFVSGTFAFALVSLALAFVPDIVCFDLLRAMQGIAAAAAFSGGAAVLAQEFDDASRTRAFSFLGASFGFGLAFGPIASGVLVEAFGWRSIFLFVIVFTSTACVLGARALRESRDPGVLGFDWPGSLSFTLALALFTCAILQGPQSGWSSPWVAVPLLGAAAVFAFFVVIERRTARPMLDLGLFRYPRFVGVQLLAAAPAYAFVVLLVLLPIRFIGIEAVSESSAGWTMLALSLPLLVLPLFAGWLARWFGVATICSGGLFVCAAGLLWLSGFAAGETTPSIMAPVSMIGIGISLPWGLMDGLAVSVVPTERAGMAAGIFNTTRVAGEGVALAAVSALLSTLSAKHLAAGRSLSIASDATAAAQRLVTGDVARAIAAFPAAGRSGLVHAYATAFSTLLVVLASITALTAVVIALFLQQAQRGKETGGIDAVDGAA